jgi:hypothetical protein
VQQIVLKSLGFNPLGFGVVRDHAATDNFVIWLWGICVPTLVKMSPLVLKGPIPSKKKYDSFKLELEFSNFVMNACLPLLSC